MGKLLKKDDLNRFLYKIKTQQELIAPVKTDAVRFEKIQFISQIDLSKNPDFPPKKYFIQSSDTLFTFKDSKISLPKKEKEKVIFGLRLCDTNAIGVLDKIFLNKNQIYTMRRERTTLIGIKCKREIEKNCFCTSFSQNNKADLFFHDIGDSYYIEVLTDKGLKLVSRLKDYTYETEGIKTRKRLEKKDLSKYYEHKAWKDMGKKCISCGLCTSICPTCPCYSQDDKTTLEKTEGERIRTQISCQHKGFWQEDDDAQVLTNKDYRQRHRIYHKLDYFRKAQGIEMCTGCGRCITSCPKGIDFVKTVNSLK